MYAVGTEDMDALTFGTTVLLRHLTFSEARKMPIKEFHLDKVLEGMELSMDQFVDLCILLGCDYCEKIRGMGPKSALREVANLLADVFDDDDFVPTDIAAALLLLYEQHHRNSSSGVRSLWNMG